jgi:hypothetical protein
MKIEIIKNYQDNNRYRLKGIILDVTPWKAEELVKRKVAKVAFKKVETAERIDIKEER